MSGGVFIIDESFIGCRFERIRKKDSDGDFIECQPEPVGIFIGYERDFDGSTSFFFYDESNGSFSRNKVYSLHHFSVVEEDRYHLVKRVRYNLKFPKKKIRDIPREELIDLD